MNKRLRYIAVGLMLLVMMPIAWQALSASEWRWEAADGGTIRGMFIIANPVHDVTVELRQHTAAGELMSTVVIPVAAYGVTYPVITSFEINGVASGTYSLIFRQPGHTSFTINGVMMPTGGNVHISSDPSFPTQLPLYPGDVNGDGQVNISDVAILLQNWLQNNAYANFTGSGQVNISDMALLLQNWMATSVVVDAVPLHLPTPTPTPSEHAPIVHMLMSTPIVGQYYSRAIQASGAGPIAWAVTGGNVPPGLSVDSSTGVVSGTPTVLGNFRFTVRAENAFGYHSAYVLITILPPSSTAGRPPFIRTLSVERGQAGQAYSASLSASGVGPIAWYVVSGNLPAGLSLDRNTGTIAGMPTAYGDFRITIRAQNMYGYSLVALSMTVKRQLTSMTLPNRRLTDAERAEWIADYRHFGGPTAEELEVIRLINIQRANHGLAPVQLDETMMQAARFFAQQHNDLRGLHPGWGHNFGPYATNPSARTGASANVARAFGVNLLWGGGNGNSDGRASASGLVSDWMNSTEHRAYIMAPEQRFIGIGQFPGGISYLFLSAEASTGT